VVLGVSEIDGPALDRFDENFRENAGIDFQSELQRVFWFQALAHPAEALAGDGLVEPQPAAPEHFAPERVVAKDLPPLLEHPT
jgi:hypothetical protein